MLTAIKWHSGSRKWQRCCYITNDKFLLSQKQILLWRQLCNLACLWSYDPNKSAINLSSPWVSLEIYVGHPRKEIRCNMQFCKRAWPVVHLLRNVILLHSGDWYLIEPYGSNCQWAIFSPYKTVIFITKVNSKTTRQKKTMFYAKITSYIAGATYMLK
jgi:hypothetical protein